MSEIPIDNLEEILKIRDLLILCLATEQENKNRPIVLNFLHELIEKAQALTASVQSPVGPEIPDDSPGWAQTARRLLS